MVGCLAEAGTAAAGKSLVDKAGQGLRMMAAYPASAAGSALAASSLALAAILALANILALAASSLASAASSQASAVSSQASAECQAWAKVSLT